MSNEDGRLQYKCIDRKAVLAEGGDAQAVRELADAVVEFNGTAHAPEVVVNQLEERLARAELNYRNDHTRAIQPQNIVLAVNNLSQKLDAPAYARTDLSEIMLLRDVSRSEMPHFISLERQTMSPLEAAYVIHLLIYQKLINETFLLTPTERAASAGEEAANRTIVKPKQPRPASVDPRVKEMLAFARKAGSMKMTYLIATAQEFLDEVGIDR